MSGVALLSPHDVAAQTGLSYHAVLRAIRAGELQATKVCSRILIRPEWLEVWIEANRVRPAEPARREGVPRRRRVPRDDQGPGSVGRLRAIELEATG